MPLSLDAAEFRLAYLELKFAGDGLDKDLREGVKAAGQEAVDAVKAAASWSHKIPPATKLKISFAARGAGVTVMTNAKQAPNARPINHGGRGGTFRHPVFPNPEETREKWNWAPQAAVPFFTAAAKAGDLTPQIQKVLDDVAFHAGFK